MIRYIPLLICTLLLAESTVEQNAKDYRNVKNQSKAVVKSTVKESVGGEDTKKWTPRDWQKNSGVNSNSVIGNNQMRMQGMTGGANIGSNPNLMTTEGIQKDTNFKDDASLNAFTGDTINNIISSSTSHNATANLFKKDITCYITRDIPIRHKCSFTGLIYGDGINQDGLKAKNQCESECYEQFEASEIISEGSIPNISLETMTISTPTEEEFITYKETDAYKNAATDKEREELEHTFLYRDNEKELELNSIYSLTSLSFTTQINDDKFVYMTASYIDKKTNMIYPIINNIKINKNQEYKFNVGNVAKSIKIKIWSESTDVSFAMKNISLNYDGGSYICSHLQDISRYFGGDYAYVCPSGRVKELNKGYKNYRICEDYGTVGDNYDGTFSTQKEANTICKKNYECTVDIKVLNTDILKTFREGCIEGQENCEEDTCKQLRLNGNMIVEENVFDAGTKPIQTIVNGNQIPGVQRPRILLQDDVAFSKRTAEELKDEAYQNMLSAKTFKSTNVTIGENTKSSSAYNIGISQNGSYANNARRALIWLYKPASNEVDNGNKKFYSIFDVIVEKKIKNENGKTEKIKDRIFYLKIDDYHLKPFARYKNWAKNVALINEDGNGEFENSKLETSALKYASFNTSTNTWYTHSKTMQAEYFKNEEITLEEKPFLRIGIISNMMTMLNDFKGIVRSITKEGPIEKYNYIGDYTASGEHVLKVTNYCFIKDSTETLTYKDIVELIENKEIKPIYDSLEYGKMQKDVEDDTGSIGGDIQLYMYGKDTSKTGFTRIFPKKEDVGKAGFIYLFAVEE